jgi:hypothetical protein
MVGIGMGTLATRHVISGLRALPSGDRPAIAHRSADMAIPGTVLPPSVPSAIEFFRVALRRLHTGHRPAPVQGPARGRDVSVQTYCWSA